MFTIAAAAAARQRRPTARPGQLTRHGNAPGPAPGDPSAQGTRETFDAEDVRLAIAAVRALGRLFIQAQTGTVGRIMLKEFESALAAFDQRRVRRQNIRDRTGLFGGEDLAHLLIDVKRRLHGGSSVCVGWSVV